MKPIVQYRFKGRLISREKAARIGNLPSASKYLSTYYREKYRGPSLYKTEGYKSGPGLQMAVALTKDRKEREDRIQRRAEIEARGREREVTRRVQYERRRVEYPMEDEEDEEEPDRPVFPYEPYEPEETGYPERPSRPVEPEEPEEEYEQYYDLDDYGGDIQDWEYNELDDYDLDDIEVADIDSDVYEER